jgi:hypothetical protein
MRRTVQVFALVLLLSSSAFAGIMQCPAPTTPPQRIETTQGGAVTNDDMQFPVTATEIALDLLAALPLLR